MKNLFTYLLIIFFFSSCNKDDDNPQTLPPATQTGAGTFGCLVNGEPFVDNSGFFNCFYQLIDGEYYFGIASTRDFGHIKQIVMLSWMKEIALDVNTPLDERLNGNFFSEIAFDCLCPSAVTTSSSNGFVRFTKFSTDSNIVSARFEFKVTDPTTGTVYEIIEGRFDAVFTQ